MRAQVLELVLVFVILGVLLVASMLGFKLYNEFTESDAWSDTEAGQTAKAGAESSMSVINYGFAFLLGGLLIAMIVSALYIKTHPIFFVLSLILLIFVVMVSGPIANTFMGIYNDDAFADERSTFSIAAYITGNLPIIAVIGGFIVMIALYAKPRGGEI